MPPIHNKLPIIGVLAVLVILAIRPLTPATSQTVGTLQPGFGQAIVVLNRAESAGATSSEVSKLVALLNKALELNREALKLNATDEAETRAALLGQVDQILTTVKNRAIELTVAASQRSYNTRVLTYLGGAIAAVLGTITYAFAVSFYQKYRIKRTFQMRVIRK